MAADDPILAVRVAPAETAPPGRGIAGRQLPDGVIASSTGSCGPRLLRVEPAAAAPAVAAPAPIELVARAALAAGDRRQGQAWPEPKPDCCG